MPDPDVTAHKFRGDLLVDLVRLNNAISKGPISIDCSELEVGLGYRICFACVGFRFTRL
jgi:hypothetical protein